MNKPPSSPAPTTAAAPSPGARLILDGAAIERCLKRIAHEIVERHPDLSRIALIGIPSRGVHLAARLAEDLEQIAGVRPFSGVVDVSMHRDDLSRHRIPPPVERTELPRELSEQTIVLIDDVLFSGRTCRAAMESIASFGRPARIQYAVLIDRGHRELPIRADYVGKNLPTAHAQRVYVRLEAVDQVADSVWME